MELFQKVNELYRAVDKLGAEVTFGFAETRKDISENDKILKDIQNKIDEVIKNQTLVFSIHNDLLGMMRKQKK